jgi:hypothetical protein
MPLLRELGWLMLCHVMWPMITVVGVGHRHGEGVCECEVAGGRAEGAGARAQHDRDVVGAVVGHCQVSLIVAIEVAYRD